LADVIWGKKLRRGRGEKESVKEKGEKRKIRGEFKLKGK
jgi:hypothetical protein